MSIPENENANDIARRIYSVSDLLHDARDTPRFYPAPGVLTSAAVDLFPTIQARRNQVRPDAFAAVVVCVVYGMRIGELLRLQSCDICKGDMVVVEAEKGSAAYRIFLPGAWKWRIVGGVEGELARLFPCSYRQAYECASKLGVKIEIEGSCNNRVTHAGRYLAADAALKACNERVASDILHHRNAKSVLHYLNRRSR